MSMTLEGIKAHNDVLRNLNTNNAYAQSWKLQIVEAVVAAIVTRDPTFPKDKAHGIAVEAAERFMTNFTK